MQEPQGILHKLLLNQRVLLNNLLGQAEQLVQLV